MIKEKKKTNWVLTIVLILGTVTVLFPLYMAVIIAFKNPSEMTNDVAGALSFPKQWSFDNFRQAMEVTDFWHSLGNSLFVYCQWYVCSFFYFNDASGKADGTNGTWKPCWCYPVVSGILYAYECPALQWILKKYTDST